MSRLTACGLLVLSLSLGTLRAEERVVIAPDQPLSLEDAVALALHKNFNLQMQGYTLENARNTVESARALFDPTLTASLTRSGRETVATTTRLEGTKDEDTVARIGLSERIAATNGTVSVTTNLRRAATNNTFTTLNPNFSNSLSVNVSQPLLRNAGRTVATADLERAKIGLSIQTLAYRNSVLNVIAQTENAYYAVVGSRESLRIRQLTTQRVQTILEENQARRALGVMTDLDVLAAEVALASARVQMIRQEQTVRDAEENLLNLINVPTFDVRPGPVAFEDYRGGIPTFAQSYARARENYPDTLSIEEQIKQLEITVAVARQNLRPQVNLDASYGLTARPVSTGYGDVVSNLLSDRGDNWAVGVSYSLPWGRRADRANFRTQSNNLSSQRIRLEQLEQQLLVQVRATVRSVETQLAAVEIAGRATELASRQYDQQKARYDAGLSTARLLLQFHEDLEARRFDELNAKLQLRRAIAELNRFEGTSLERFRVQLP
jgi:outer membrane protein